MTKGTTSMGKRQKRTHGKCRRCGSVSYSIHKRQCASCGFGKTSKMRGYSWTKRTVKYIKV
ncbi:MAG: 50S ribosomal protein L37e [Methanosarcinales archaeon Met12]|nr:MAG: 50S ribosomal protein L37e [Methanosarcinales archaeon Met12]